jgi:hypothetical protein
VLRTTAIVSRVCHLLAAEIADSLQLTLPRDDGVKIKDKEQWRPSGRRRHEFARDSTDIQRRSIREDTMSERGIIKSHAPFIAPSSESKAEIERRTVLKGSFAAAGIFGSVASTAMLGDVGKAVADTAPSQLPDQIQNAIERFRASIPANFDHDYVEKAVIPFFLTSFYEGERPMLPMIGVNFSKENALPYDLWGLITRDWRPTPEAGVTVFLQGLEKRGDNNLRKRIYFSA